MLKRLILIAVCIAPGGILSGEGIEPLNLKNLPSPEPGRKYSFEIRPRRDRKPVKLVLVTADGGPEIERIIQPGVSEIAVTTETPQIDLEIDDYDGDGFSDFRLATNSGTGGTWYAYFRYDGRKYVAWEEPGRLEINAFDKKKGIAIASSRSGPSYQSSFYKLVRGHFVLIGREIHEKARHYRELIPEGIADDDYVLIKEELKDGKVVKRQVTKDNPSKDEPEK